MYFSGEANIPCYLGPESFCRDKCCFEAAKGQPDEM